MRFDGLKSRLRRVLGQAAAPSAAFVASPFVAQPGVLPPSWQRYAQYVSIHPTTLIAPSSNLTIFNPPTSPRICIEIGAGSHVFSNFSLLRPEATIRIGRDCQLGASQFVAAQEIVLGDDILLAWGATLIDSDTHSKAWEVRQFDVKCCYEDYLADPTNLIKRKSWDDIPAIPISVGGRSWIGFNSIILKGVRLSNNVIVGAGAVVTKNVDAFQIVAGNPARVIGSST